MQITVQLLAGYRRYLPEPRDPQGRSRRDVPSGARVRDVVAGLPIPPDNPTTFLVNGRHAEADQVLHEGDTVTVFPAVGGG